MMQRFTALVLFASAVWCVAPYSGEAQEAVTIPPEIAASWSDPVPTTPEPLPPVEIPPPAAEDPDIAQPFAAEPAPFEEPVPTEPLPEIPETLPSPPAPESITDEPIVETPTVAVPTVEAVPPSGAAAFVFFAGGDFRWMEAAFEKVPGVLNAVSGFSGGTLENPSYDQVRIGGTGHYMTVKVIFDRSVVNYDTLLATFWMSIDPFNENGQFCEKGRQYRPAILFRSPEERSRAEDTARIVSEDFDRDVRVAIIPAGTFYPADENQQDFHRKNADAYEKYVKECRRSERLKELWGSDEPWMERLTQRTKGPVRKKGE